jgi:hypothetical protein
MTGVDGTMINPGFFKSGQHMHILTDPTPDPRGHRSFEFLYRDSANLWLMSKANVGIGQGFLYTSRSPSHALRTQPRR